MAFAFLGARAFFSFGASTDSVTATSEFDSSALYSGFGVRRVMILSSFAFNAANWSLLLFCGRSLF